MPTRRKGKTPDLKHGPELQLDNGTILRPDDEFTVKGEGRYRFRYVWPPDGSVACYGPFTAQGAPKPDAMNRYFAPERITRVHRKKKVAQ